jgi:hypothetical protein
MDQTQYAFWMSVVGNLCWVVCFWWMYRISNKQNILLDQLREQGKRIEMVSRIEHDLIKEVHPQVAGIKEGMDALVSVAKEATDSKAMRSPNDLCSARKTALTPDYYGPDI